MRNDKEFWVDYDVAIVGYGPVGALMANLLGARGIRTLVLEKDTEIYKLPRAVGLDDEVMRILQSADLEQAFTESSAPLLGMNLLKPNGRRLRRISTEDEPQNLGHPVLALFHQPTFEKHLRAGVKRFETSVDVQLGATVTDVREVEDGIDIDVSCDESGAPSTYRAQYLLGCDGGRSVVRKLFGIDHHDYGLHQPWVVIDVLMNRPYESDGYADQICDPKRPGTFVPTAAPRKRWEFMLTPEDDHDEVLKPEWMAERIRPWAAPEDYEFERAAVYTFHAISATAWRTGNDGKIFLMGDAAHQMPPFLGQGMCAGVRDAFNLAWKLDLVLRGVAPSGLLDTYQSEREAHVREVIRTAVRVGELIQSSNMVKTYFIHAAMMLSEKLGLRIPLRAAKWLPLGEGFFSEKHAPKKASRVPFPQPTVRMADGSSGRLDDYLGPFFTLLSRPPCEGLENSYIQAFQIVSEGESPDCENSMVDLDGHVIRWMKENRCDAVLVRPDRQAFGVYAGAAAVPSRILSDLASQLPKLKVAIETTSREQHV